jgi:hypothetical protein
VNQASDICNFGSNLGSRVWLVYLLVGVRRYRPKPVLPWYVVAFGLMLFVTADVIYYNVYGNVLGMQAPFPSVADIFYTSSYLVVAVGLAIMARRSRGDATGAA